VRHAGPTAERPTVAMFLWGDLFEDFYDTIGVSLERFRTEFTGSWVLGYVAALETADVRTVLVACSARVETVERFVHEPTGTDVVVMPAPRRHRWARAAHRRLRRRALRAIASYLSLPLLATRRELRRMGAAAILAQEYEDARTDVLVLLGRGLRLPVFASFQSAAAPLSRFEAVLRPRFARGLAGLIIAPAAERERVLTAYGVPPGRLADIPNAFDVLGHRTLPRSEARGRLGIAETTTVVEWHGRISIRAKGLDVLLDAWEQVCRERPEADLLLLLVGGGADADELRERIEATGLGSIRWRDEFILDRDELLPYPSAADIYVLPSRVEGFPVAPIEAMAAGLPVVAADASGVPDILPDGEDSGGIVVPREDADALAAALGRLIDDPQRRVEVGSRGRARAEAIYSLEVVGAQLRVLLLREDASVTRGR
jgi:glycosyltransferase involved in cell wall biosynthesis